MLSVHVPHHPRSASFRLLPWVESWWLFVLLAALVWLLTGLAGCGGGGGGGGGGAQATLDGLALDPAAPSVPLGATVQLHATGSYSDGSTRDLTTGAAWSTSDGNVASVGPDGVARGLAVGDCTVTATFGGFQATAPLAVGPPALASIALDPAQASVVRGAGQLFVATGTYTDGSTLDHTASAAWSTTNPAVAVVVAPGQVLSLEIGSTTVRAAVGAIAGTATLEVLPPPLVSIEVTPAGAELPAGQTLAFHAVGTYQDATTLDLTAVAAWSSSAPGVATIAAGGVARGVNPGTTTIAASSAGVTGSAGLTVIPEVLVSVAVTPEQSLIARRSTLQMTATGTYSTGRQEDVTSQAAWTSGAPAVAAVSNTAPTIGRVTAMISGFATITATHGGVSGGAAVRVIVPLARTGQTSCYDAAGAPIDCRNTGQDGELQQGVAWPAPRFVVGSGPAVTCVTDHLTGLMWQRSPDGTTARDWSGALADAQAATLGGFDDWRLPTRRELRSLIDVAEPNDAVWLGNQGFQVLATDYWSSTTLAYLPTNAWNVDMYQGTVDVYDKLGGPRLWLVRDSGELPVAEIAWTGQTSCFDTDGDPIDCAGTGQDGDLQPGAPWPSPRFTPGTGAEAASVLDELTGLVWLRAPEATQRTWPQALEYANALVAGGHDDWRLPNAVEQESLFDAAPVDAAAWLTSQGFGAVPQGYFWTSTSLAPPNADKAWAVMASYGYVWIHSKGTALRAWAVRGP